MPHGCSYTPRTTLPFTLCLPLPLLFCLVYFGRVSLLYTSTPMYIPSFHSSVSSVRPLFHVLEPPHILLGILLYKKGSRIYIQGQGKGHALELSVKPGIS